MLEKWNDGKLKDLGPETETGRIFKYSNPQTFKTLKSSTLQIINLSLIFVPSSFT